MIRRFGIFALMSFSAGLLAAEPATEDFESGSLEGWAGNTTMNTVVHQASGGNPGGYLLSSHNSNGGPVGAVNTDPTWTGAFDSRFECLGVDLQAQGGPVNGPVLRIRNSFSSNGWTYELTPALADGAWVRYEVMFDPTWSDVDATANGWVTSFGEPAFATTMADHVTFEIRGSKSGATVQLGIDNITQGACGGPGVNLPPVPPVVIPTLGQVSLALLATLLGLLGFAALSRTGRI